MGTITFSYSTHKFQVCLNQISSSLQSRYDVTLYQHVVPQKKKVGKKVVWAGGRSSVVDFVPPSLGGTYTVVVEAFSTLHGRRIGHVEHILRAEYSKDQLCRVLGLAKTFNKRNSRRMPCKWLYRNKPMKYFIDVITNKRAVEEKYIKDQNGDPANCINGQIEGLFFGANVMTGREGHGRPMSRSPFGDMRLLVPARYFLNDGYRLYFADFYCKQGHTAHWVTLVHTKRGSQADCYCANKLVELDIADNEFLWSEGRKCWVTASGVWVEVLHTENIDYDNVLLNNRGGKLENMQPGHGSNWRLGGRRKKSSCTKCNVPMEELHKASLSDVHVHVELQDTQEGHISSDVDSEESMTNDLTRGIHTLAVS